MSTATTYAQLYGLISQQITIYFGIPTLVLGITGNLFNLIVFLSLKTFRESPCAFFLVVKTAVNIGQLSTNLFTRLLITGFNIDWTESSLAFCKFRNFALQFCALMSYTSMSLATIDQVLATSFHRRWQKCIDLRKAQLFSLIGTIVWLLHGVPTLIFYNLGYSVRLGKFACVITSAFYQNYFSYGYVLVLAALLPMLVTITFGSLAYRNVRQIPYRTVPLVRRELDKQLTQMVLVQIVLSTIVVTPYVISIISVNYLAATGHTGTLVTWNFVNFLCGMIYYWHFAVRNRGARWTDENVFSSLQSPFYLNLCASKRFRQQFLHVLAGKSCGEKTVRPTD